MIRIQPTPTAPLTPLSRTALWLALLACSAASGAQRPELGQEVEFFESKIRPVLVEHCYACHSRAAKRLKGGLRLDDRQALLAGGDSGPAVVPGKPEASLIVEALRHESFEMPPDRRLGDAVVANFVRWIESGAWAPAPAEAPDDENQRDANDIPLWSFQPVRPVAPPVATTDWASNAIDAHLWRRMSEANLGPNPVATRAALLRRVTFDLSGLPPSREELRAFVSDPRPLPAAYQSVVDRLLASPRFGERWGRHWLDIARYADSTGGGRSLLYRESWRYRDYVIDAINDDKPMDRFIVEQIAGDLLPYATPQQGAKQLTATGFLALGPHNYEQQDKELLRMDVIDEQIDTIGRAFLGLTLGCARCHDHRFDPVTTRDYYAMAGVFRATNSLVDGNVSSWVKRPAPISDEWSQAIASHRQSVAALDKKIQRTKKRFASLERRGLGEGIVVDDADADTVTFRGQWAESNSVQGFIGEGYRYANGPNASATYRVRLPAPGEYRVWVSYTPHGNRARAAGYSIRHAGGVAQRTIDQTRRVDDGFADLGRFVFDSVAQITLQHDSGDGALIADAIRLESANEPIGTAAEERKRAIRAQVQSVKKELAALTTERERLKSSAPSQPPQLVCVEEQPPAEIGPCHIRIRGNHQRLGDATPRGVISALAEHAPVEMPKTASGRLELANWIASAKNPLTARVLVNRAWGRLFGEGLVRSVDNFGQAGVAPSHPELLDHLAASFVEQGWSLKSLVRRIVSSRAYQQSDAETAAHARIDPDNQWLARQNRRRLEAEAIHDAMLALAGQLREQTGGDTVRPGTKSEYGYQFESGRRGVYYPIFRNRLPDLLAAFDYPDPNRVAGRRNVSTLASQQLVLSNSPRVVAWAEQAAQRLHGEFPRATDAERVQALFEHALSRPPTRGEVSIAMRHLRDERTGSREHRWTMLCEALMGSVDFRYR